MGEVYSVERDGAQVLAVAEHYLRLGEALLEGFTPEDSPRSGGPLNKDLDLDVEPSEVPDRLAGLASFSSEVLVPFLADLQDRDFSLFATGDQMDRTVVMHEILSTDHHNYVTSVIGAEIANGEYGSLYVPLGIPVNDALISQAQFLGPADRVRFVTEFVRTLSNLVRTTRLPEGLLSNTIGHLALAVSFLRDSVAALRDARSNNAHDEREASKNDQQDIGNHAQNFTHHTEKAAPVARTTRTAVTPEGETQ